MMYRCRLVRIALPTFLSLAIIMAFFVFPASAEGSMNAYVTLKYNEDGGSSWTETTRDGLANGLMTYTPHKYWALSGITYVHNNCDTDVWFSFNFYGAMIGEYESGSSYFLQNINGDGKLVGTSSSGKFEVWCYQSTDVPNQYIDYGYYNLHNSWLFIVHFTYTAGSATGNTSFFTPTAAIKFYSNGNARTPICPGYANVTFYNDFSQVLAAGLLDINTNISAIAQLVNTQNSLINSLYGNISNIKDYTQNLSAKCNTLFNSTYLWTQLSYNSTSEAIESSTASGNWFDAVLGSIQSLSSDAEAQAAQQQKAMDAGAGDALDDVYNSMGSGSFGALSDFTDLTDLGSWNSGSYDTNSSNLLTSWFSQSNKNAISNIPQTRDNDIVDFYHQNILDIEEGVSDGSAD